ncbi:cation diffusion facilitator CzcD-associated flavoprotein CzcO [Novosphingobium kunmingense]|uniref:Cation diffusion facilitator CzcD-associated flavoprotein CzcO n=1 Tax=Novosphingobium kunmingense TaxID=1211806 RepID=A0A2N0HJN8_9SPHN|nr:NAD(P)/FAD-dependent oxidoreductase [Novosphingobium kunmingense]PKB19160.1 cation diffusion facilitator CzcD-associated flavoprotein CzcO [Novosphingobium kunmingense]
MNAVATSAAKPGQTTHFDVLIVGAGISGIGSAYHLQDQCPGKSYAILEMKDTFGGTWETHKYPGVRSDSDLYTFGYRFKPWVGTPIASAEAILTYMREVIEEYGIDEHIRYGHRITACDWDSKTNLWTVTAQTGDGAAHRFTCNFLWMCQGYYDHEHPYLPEWPGMEKFKGTLVHAQLWDPKIDYAGKRVLVIGSGATAATVVPAFAEKAAHVTMLQRSPTYFFAAPNMNELADKLRAGGIDEPTIHRVVRAQIMFDQDTLCRRCQDEPEAVVAELQEAIKAYAGPDFQFEPHFTPKYRVWQQRLAYVPDGDLFQAVAAGKASVVTDTIKTFTEKGVRTASGQEIEADIIVPCTGFHLSVMGKIPFTVDGRSIDWADTLTYRGMMFTGVPNLAHVFGYFRASWTLRVDMLGDFVTRLLKHMDDLHAKKVEVTLRDEDHNMPHLPWIEAENFNPNYLMRDIDKMPRRGDKPEWRHNQDYWAEKNEFPAIDIDGDEFLYDGKRARQRQTEAA